MSKTLTMTRLLLLIILSPVFTMSQTTARVTEIMGLPLYESRERVLSIVNERGGSVISKTDESDATNSRYRYFVMGLKYYDLVVSETQLEFKSNRLVGVKLIIAPRIGTGIMQTYKNVCLTLIDKFGKPETEIEKYDPPYSKKDKSGKSLVSGLRSEKITLMKKWDVASKAEPGMLLSSIDEDARTSISFIFFGLHIPDIVNTQENGRALSKWRLIGLVGNDSVFIRNAHAGKTGKIVKVWVRYVYGKPREFEGKICENTEIMQLYDLDFDDLKYRSISYTTYCKSNVIDKFDDKGYLTKWDYASPDSAIETIILAAKEMFVD